MNKVTRLEVIDENGRVYVLEEGEFEHAYRKFGRTVKITLRKNKEKVEEALEQLRKSNGGVLASDVYNDWQNARTKEED